MIPKARGMLDIERAASAVDEACMRHGHARTVPLHALVETHGALREVQLMAAHPRIESLSFGVMDFVSAHRGAIPQWAMSVQGQFEHPLVVRAKLEIAAACHGHGKTPSHCVVTEFTDLDALRHAAEQASQHLGYTRMWSIHPSQIRTIVRALSPSAKQIEVAVEILQSAASAQWAPIRHHNTLHDRASYRYFWQVLERAQKSAMVGQTSLPQQVVEDWFS
jgi:citrate lyase subunit beta / citryl-CoA lyase